MNLIKAIIRIAFKVIDDVIDFIDYIFNIRLSKLPKFLEIDNKNQEEKDLEDDNNG